MAIGRGPSEPGGEGYVMLVRVVPKIKQNKIWQLKHRDDNMHYVVKATRIKVSDSGCESGSFSHSSSSQY